MTGSSIQFFFANVEYKHVEGGPQFCQIIGDAKFVFHHLTPCIDFYNLLTFWLPFSTHGVPEANKFSK